MLCPTKKLGAKQWRQQKASDAEFNFEKFCREKNILCTKLEVDETARQEFLKVPNGKCPDFLCKKDNQCIIVEMKTHTRWTNKARDQNMAQTIQNKRVKGLSTLTFVPLFDPTEELMNVYKEYLKSANYKFKNIKEDYDYPRILLLNGYHTHGTDIINVFTGLFRSKGSHVSAVVYQETGCEVYERVDNPRAIVKLSEEIFKYFFENEN